MKNYLRTLSLLTEADGPQFKTIFKEISAKLKVVRKRMNEEAVGKMTKEMEGKLRARGLIISLLNISIGAFRGHSYITSAKIEVGNKPPFVDEDDSRVKELLTWLQEEWSPKFKLKGVENGIARFNVR